MNFVNNFKNNLFHINECNFNEKALELFKYQAGNNNVYKEYLNLLGVNPDSVVDIVQIPFLPIQFFKTREIFIGDNSYEVVFYSSGTTGEIRSNHFVKDLQFYTKNAELIFQEFYGDIKDYTILALLPSYLENKNSSLIYMINHLIGKASGQSGFMLDEFENIEHAINKSRRENKKIILWGVSYALLDLAEAFPMDLSDVIILETGGMKGRREEITKEALHNQLKVKFNADKIHSEYGMTELLSQAYSKGDGIFICPKWMKVLIREMHDPFSLSQGPVSGGVNVIDLANVDSCAFIETQDLGRLLKDGSFEIKGRMDNSDIRGCNLLYIE